ncbi:MAG: AraC family transcriptional regulator [Syntrophomonadaceae bacterium]|nr:AraC family transcriptional regulator [Syntrophomonadaceae bacterium]
MTYNYSWFDTAMEYPNIIDRFSEDTEFLEVHSSSCKQLIPKDFGEGYLQYTSTSAYPVISACDFYLHKPLSLVEQVKDNNVCMLSFCLSDGFEWSLAGGDGGTFSIAEKESCIMMESSEKCISHYSRERQYKGIGIGFPAERLSGVIEYLNSGAITRHSDPLGELKRYTVTPRIEIILQQILCCKICGVLRDVYLEGKLLELIAVYIDEMVCERGKNTENIPLSSDDLASLEQAKKILDQNYVQPLTLSQLSKKVCLNEYKLKVGFKDRYDQTVYGYILDKRMELARLLLEQGKFKVTDIAGMVGYANASHFIEAFQKKFGMTPGVYLRNTGLSKFG